MLTNRLGRPNGHLTMSPNHNVHHLTLASMVTHFRVVMTCVRDYKLLQPLLRLIANPQQMQVHAEIEACQVCFLNCFYTV